MRSQVLLLVSSANYYRSHCNYFQEYTRQTQTASASSSNIVKMEERLIKVAATRNEKQERR